MVFQCRTFSELLNVVIRFAFFCPPGRSKKYGDLFSGSRQGLISLMIRLECVDVITRDCDPGSTL